MNIGKVFRAIFNPWVLGGALAFGLILMLVSLGVLWGTRSNSFVGMPATAVFTVIYAPTETPIPSTPTTSPIPTPVPDQQGLVIGAYAQVADTGGVGLRLRYTPGLKGQVHLLAAEGESFQIKDGPVESDGYTWWYVVNPQDEKRYGWAVSDFFRVVQIP